MRFVPILAVIVTAMALYVSRIVLDQFVTDSGLMRVALLPPWQSVAAFVGVGFFGLLWLDRRAVPRQSATAVHPSIAPLLLPLFGLVLLFLPYLPFLPDRIPVLQVLAGPIRGIVWLVIATQLAWVLWQQRFISADWLQRLSVRQLAVGIGIVSALVTGAAATRLAGSALYPGGDEPHYLVMAQSLWRDGDLRIENNHTRGDYREYFPRDLEPHFLTRGRDNEIYSIHPVGMPVLIAPIYAAGGYFAVIIAFVIIAALAAGVMWHTVMRIANSAGSATFGWAAVVATSPFLFNAFAVYPEIPAALAVAIAFSLITASDSTRLTRWLAVGVACAVLPWLSTKYAPMSAALVTIALGRIVASAPSASGARGAGVAAATVVVPYGVSLLGWFYFFYAFWGSPMPQVVYGKLVQTELTNLTFGAPGLLFDQEYGLLPYAPVYILAATGLWVMWRSGAATRRTALELVVVFAALLGTVGAFRIWWGGSASPGRPLTSGLLLLALPIAFAFRVAPMASATRAVQHLLLWVSVGVSGVLLIAEYGFLTANGRDGTSALLEYVSPRWPAWTMAPSFIQHEAPTALVHTALWLLLAAAAAVLIARARTTKAGVASLIGVATTSAALLLAALVFPSLPLGPPWASFDVRARGRLPLLEEFDTSVRPAAIELTPLRVVSPSSVVATGSLEAGPGLRTEQQPVRILHNGRFSLPAGTYRIEVEWNGSRSGETIGIQVGRSGEAWQTFPVDPRPGERWTREVVLPLDVVFLGLRGTPELERIVQRIRVIPLTVVDRSKRPRSAEVIGASQSGAAALFYVDPNAFPESKGFWVQGGRHTRVAFARASSAGPLTLRVHSGPLVNRLHIAANGWHKTLALQPQSPENVSIDGAVGQLVTLDLAADLTFVPREIDAKSTDPRPLGVWIEVVQ